MLVFAAMILVLEATRRAVGLPITIIASAFILYMYYGRLMPGFLAHRGYDWDDIVKTMFFTSEGILGTPLYSFIHLYLPVPIIRSFSGQDRCRAIF